MVKEETIDLRYKIKSTSEVLRTQSPTKIARAILDGLNPPKLTEKALVRRVQRLLEKKNEDGWQLRRKPGSGRPRTVLTPVGLGRIKKSNSFWENFSCQEKFSWKSTIGFLRKS